MRIDEIQLKKIGGFDDVTLKFPKNTLEHSNKANIHIFTGENGSGKTTVLLALAGLIRGRTSHEKEGRKIPESQIFLAKRMRVFSEKKEEASQIIAKIDNETIRLFACGKCHTIHHFDTQLSQKLKRINEKYQSSERYYIKSAEIEKMNTAAFAYSGYRYMHDANVTGAGALNFDPLAGALEFVKDATQFSEKLVNWVYDAKLRAAYLKESHQNADSDAVQNSVETAEKLLSELMGKTVCFELSVSRGKPAQVLLKIENQILDLDVLPDGVRSLLSWTADLLIRLDAIPWQGDLPLLERNILLFLDEVEVHLHPKWQRKVLPVIQKMFPNAQIFVSSHSPFVVNSIDGAWIHSLVVDAQGSVTVSEPKISNSGESYSAVLDDIFGVSEDFGKFTQEALERFHFIKNKIFKSEATPQEEAELLKIAREIAPKSLLLGNMIQFELRQLNRITQKNFEI